jgi:hypothetical protein
VSYIDRLLELEACDRAIEWLKAGDLKTVLLDFEPHEDVNFEVRMLTEEEAEGLPDFNGWYPLPDCE